MSRKDVEEKDPFFDVYEYNFHSSKWYRVTLLKTLAKRLPKKVRDLVIELADFWLENNAQEKRKGNTLERAGRAFFHIKMYRDMGFSVSDAVDLASKTVDSSRGLRRAWDRRELAKVFKRLPRMQGKMSRTVRDKLWRKIMG